MGLEMVAWTVSRAGGGHCGETWTPSWLTQWKETKKTKRGGESVGGQEWNFRDSISLIRGCQGEQQGFQRVGWVSRGPSLVCSPPTYLRYHQCQRGYVSNNRLMVSSPVSPRHFIRQIKSFLLLLRGFFFPMDVDSVGPFGQNVRAAKEDGYSIRIIES